MRNTLSCFQRIISQYFIGDDSKEDTPVPIPNTEVKLFYGEDSVKAKIASCQFFFVFFSINIGNIFVKIK